jgi:hypothetical protein
MNACPALSTYLLFLMTHIDFSLLAYWSLGMKVLSELLFVFISFKISSILFGLSTAEQKSVDMGFHKKLISRSL